MSTSTAVALVRPSPFDILPAPPPRARHLRNARKLLRLASEAASTVPWWEWAADEVGRQLLAEGFVVLDSFAGDAAAHQLRDTVLSALDSAGRGGLSGGGAASVLRGDKTVWADRSDSLDALLRRLDALVALLAERVPDAARAVWRSDAQFSVYPANNTRYVRHVDNTCSNGRGRLCNGRRLSAVYYLNPSWNESDGGALRISRKPEGELDELPEIDVAPQLDRLALFWADSRNPHEVLPSAASRRAVTVWYFADDELSASSQDTAAMVLHRTAPRPRRAPSDGDGVGEAEAEVCSAPAATPR